uniref:UPAR/Ly6 domain-containing protein n=1 Tax=Panagrellus redivivus TaxID=6233 RepID=A0A7E4VD84_PANRE
MEYGSTSEECESETDYCYRFVADLNILSNVKKGGCSTYRCFLNQNKCIKQKIQGYDVDFCCCNKRDFCNTAHNRYNLSLFGLLFVFVFNYFV